MVKKENRCCDCAVPAYPCRGASCPNRSVPVYYCDNCRNEIEGDVYFIDDEHFCRDCIKERNEDDD